MTLSMANIHSTFMYQCMWKCVIHHIPVLVGHVVACIPLSSNDDDDEAKKKGKEKPKSHNFLLSVFVFVFCVF